ncbi:hypothetical protein [Vampirovibrio chlorellavorus]|uniref:hypothetical protein n=1 Tax=Vampirovibrio chlorellavorus TaxID=758823 RepID=UPI0026EA6331|nr:hypothetical protein [Vampirovibrio chlorellavorus]
MKPKKILPQTGLLPKLKNLLEALSDRYQRVLGVIDEALDSDSMKDKIWAVDLILKRTPTESPSGPASGKGKKTDAPLNPADLEQLSEQELLNRVRTYIQDWEP